MLLKEIIVKFIVQSFLILTEKDINTAEIIQENWLLYVKKLKQYLYSIFHYRCRIAFICLAELAQSKTI